MSSDVLKVFFAVVFFLVPGLTMAQSPGYPERGVLRLQTSLWTTHYSPDPEHNNNQDLVNIEWVLTESQLEKLGFISYSAECGCWADRVHWLAGGAHFRNSFSQKSTYLYVGGRMHFPLSENADLYVKVTAGALHGYRGEYRDKIPFNRYEIAPAILPGIGIEYRRFHLEFVPFGAAGLMLSSGLKF